MQSEDILPGVADLRLRLQHQLEHRLEGERVGHKEDLSTCTMLDPRFKNFDFKRVGAEERAQARKWFIKNYVDNWAPTSEPDEEDVDKAKEKDEPSPKRRKVADFLDDDSDEDDAGEDTEVAVATPDPDQDEGNGESPAQPQEKEDPRRDEVMKYLALPQVIATDGFNVLNWWKDHQALFPNLAKMARQYLALPASSAGVERLFSAAGEMHDKKRKRTHESTLSHMLNIKVNAP